MGNVTVNKSMAEVGKNAQARVNIKNSCNKVVPRAAEYGSCNYYYRPYDMDILGPTTVYKIKFTRIFEISKNIFNSPDEAKKIYKKLIGGEDKLLDIKDYRWSRWHDFKSRHHNCGHEPPPYYINYGYYYCSRYVAYLYPSLTSEEGRIWLVEGRRLLQTYLDDAIQQNMIGDGVITITSKKYPDKFKKPPIKVGKYNIELMPEQFKKMAFLTHVPAYVDAGLSNVPIKWDMFRIVFGPTLNEWKDGDTWQQAYDAAMIVADDWVKPTFEFLKEKKLKFDQGIEKSGETFNSFFENFQKKADQKWKNVKDNSRAFFKNIEDWISW